MTSTTPPQEIDINFNSSSPGHRSSLDGSFIQDDDSRLLMELGSAKPFTNENTSAFSRKNFLSPLPSTDWSNSHGSNNFRYLEFDADIVANLDFDDFRRADIQNLLYPNNENRAEKSIKNDENSPLSPDLRNFLENLHFLSKSAETSANDELFINDYGNNNMETNEILISNCLKSKKLDYVLTFNNTVTESGVQCLTSVSSEQSSEENLNTFYDIESEYDNLEARQKNNLWPDIVNSLSKCNSVPNLTNFKVRLPRILSQRWNLKSKFPPKLKKHSINRSLNKQMPSILLLKNENNQSPDFQPKSIIVDDYEYSEYYLKGKYVDMNHNEVGYNLNETQGQPAPQAVLAPPLVQRRGESPGTFLARLEAKNLASSKSLKNSSTQIPIPTRDICTQTTEVYPKKWSQNINEWAKLDSLDLDFMRLAFNDAPPLFPSVKKFPRNFLDDEEDQSDSTIEEKEIVTILDNNEICTDNESVNKRDSGLGGSCTLNNLRLDKNVEGPAHVEDWDSLAFLLPDEALTTYKFFKTNTNLLENEQNMRDSKNAVENHSEKAYFKSRRGCRCRKRTLRRSVNLSRLCNKDLATNITLCLNFGDKSHSCRNSGEKKKFACFRHRQVLKCRCQKNVDDTTIDEEETDKTEKTAKTNYCMKNFPTSHGCNKRAKCKFNAQSGVNEDARQFYANFSQSFPPQCAALPCATCFRIIKSCHSSLPREDNEVLWSHRRNEICLVNIDHESEENYYKPPVEFCDCRRINDKQRGYQLDLEYNEKKNLIDAVLRSCNDFVDFSLCRTNEESSKFNYNDSYLMGKFSLSIQQILTDGLLPSKSLCNLIYYSSMLCSIPNSVRTLAENMREEQVKNTRMNVDFVFQLFVTGLLKLRNLDTYLLHLVAERRFLSHYYSPKSFLLNASSIYKDLLDKFLASIRPLTLLNFAPLSPHCSLLAQIVPSPSPFSNNNFNPAKLPPDSRIPKSSSLPSKMNARTSMIDKDNFRQSYPLVENCSKFFGDESGDEENESISTMSTDDSTDESSDCN